MSLTLRKIPSQFRELHELHGDANHFLQRVERNSDSGRDKPTDLNVAYTCATCLQVWKWAAYLEIDVMAGSTCKGTQGQSVNLRSRATRQFYNKGSATLRRDLGKIWRLSPAEKKVFAVRREALRKHCGRGVELKLLTVMSHYFYASGVAVALCFGNFACHCARLSAKLGSKACRFA